MSVVDKLLNSLRLTDEEDIIDEEFYLEEDEEERAPRISRRERRKHEAAQNASRREQPTLAAKEQPTLTEKPLQQTTTSKVTPIRSSKKKGGQETMEVCVLKPRAVEDARRITEALLANRSVVLNLEGLEGDVPQRIMDFTSGLCSAVGGKPEQVSDSIFLIAPQNVDVSGDLREVTARAGSMDSYTMDI